jgi:hypothetical protein
MLMRRLHARVQIAGAERLGPNAAPTFQNRDFNITADVTIGSGGEKGVIATEGGR